jgi:hypothetical protein
MNTKQAVRKGYQHVYLSDSTNKEKALLVAKSIRDSGHKATVVTDTQIGRIYNTRHYYVYASQSYFDYRLIDSIQSQITRIPDDILKCEQKHKSNLEEIEIKRKSLLTRLEELISQYPSKG